MQRILILIFKAVHFALESMLPQTTRRSDDGQVPSDYLQTDVFVKTRLTDRVLSAYQRETRTVRRAIGIRAKDGFMHTYIALYTGMVPTFAIFIRGYQLGHFLKRTIRSSRKSNDNPPIVRGHVSDPRT